MLTYQEYNYSRQQELDSANEKGFELADIFKYAGATIVDTAITTVDSLTFGLFDNDDVDGNFTSQALHWMNEDLGTYYDTHKEAVELGSFVGGIFLPGFAAAKAMKWGRETSTTFKGFLNGSAKWEADTMKIIHEEGAKAANWAQAYKNTKWHTIGEGVAEGAAYEFSYALFNNQHAYLDNNYDVGDYMIGASLGALVGPLSWISKSKKLTSEWNAITIARDTEKQVLPSASSILEGGDKVALYSHYYNDVLNNTKTLDPLERNIQGNARAQSQADSILADTRKIIYGMASDDFNDLWGKPRVKGEPLTFDKKLNPFEVDQHDYLLSVGIANPEFLRGIHGNKQGIEMLHPDHRRLATESAIARRTDEGYTSARGADIGQVLFINPTGGIARKSEEELLAIQDKLGIRTEVHNRTLTLEFTKTPGTEHKQWAADFLQLVQYRDNPVKVIGDVSSLKVNKKKMQDLSKLELLDLDDPHKFIPSPQWRAHVSERSMPDGLSVMDPWVPYNTITTIQAAAAPSASNYPEVLKMLDKPFNMSSKMRYDRLKQNTAMSDGYWIAGIKAVDSEAGDYKSVYNLKGSNEEVMAKLQGLAMRIEKPEEFPKMIRIEGQDFTSRAAVADYIWAWKQTEAKALSDMGASTLQIAKKLNLQPEIVDAMYSAGHKLQRGNNRPWMYTGDLNKYMENRSILLKGRGIAAAQENEISAIRMLDREHYQNFHDQTVQTALTTAPVSGGEVSNLYYEALSPSILTKIRGELPAFIANVLPARIATASRDFTLRMFGDTANVITEIGASLSKNTNALNTRHMKTITPALAAVKDNKVAAQQFAIVYRKLGGLGSAEGRFAHIREDGGQIKIAISKGEQKDTYNFMKYDNSDQDIVLTPENVRFWEDYASVRREKQALNNIINKLQGRPAQEGHLMWLPNFNLTDSFIGFKINAQDHSKFTMIAENTAERLKQAIADGRARDGSEYIYITRTDDELGRFNVLHRYAELDDLQPTNTFMAKTGVMKQELPGDIAIQQVIDNLRADTVSKMRTITKLSMQDIIQTLDDATNFSTAEARASKGFFSQKIQRPVTPSEVIRKTILNESLLGQTPAMDWANNIVTASANMAINGTAKLWANATGRDGVVDFQKLSDDMRAHGIIPTWKDYDDYLRIIQAEKGQDKAQHWLAKGHSAIVTMNLRFMEASHAIVTTLSAPVILTGELTHISKQGPGYVMKNLMEAFKFSRGKTAESRRIMKLAEEKGYTRSIIAEADEALADLARLDNSSYNAKWKSFIKTMSTPSDWSERVTREVAFATGYNIAKSKYPTATEGMLMTHASAFVKRTMGNYTSRQKPTMFQGTFGQTIGLYQTFMLTMGQNLYRYAEKGDYKAIGMLLASQATMFGVESLPFFKEFNNIAGVYASDDHEDITTTVYKVFGNTDGNSRSMAEFILYGLPSAAFGSGIYTRAALDPRSPAGIKVDDRSGLSYYPALADAGMQIWNGSFEAISNAYRGMASGGGFKDMWAAAVQGAAAQSLWRPGARWAELALGKSYDHKGEVIDRDTQDPIQEPFSFAARIIGSRPLKEHVLKSLRYRASYYNGIDRDRRANVVQAVRRIVSNGEDMDQIGNLMDDYINKYNGSYKGWGSVLKTAYAGMNTDFADRLAEYATKQPAISEIADIYGQ